MVLVPDFVLRQCAVGAARHLEKHENFMFSRGTLDYSRRLLQCHFVRYIFYVKLFM
jgi:hypothetical protein